VAVLALVKQVAQSKKYETPLSARLSEQISEVIPGGVDSPFRSFHEVGGHTIFFHSAQGAHLIDVDGNTYIDYLGAWGPAILGHCPPTVVAACQRAVSMGPVFGAPHAMELELARRLVETVPSIEKVRFVNSGTEAVMSAVRLARGVTKRDLLVMFEGCYHGHSDSVLASQSHSSSAGVPEQTAGRTVQVPYNDLEALESCLEQYKAEVAAVVVEPVAGSMGVIPPEAGFLEGLRALCTKYGALLIFDEVLTGFRVALGGAQALYGIKPDITCYGKALGGGMPIGAYGGSAEIMDHLLPLGDVYQAGTFSGNPVTMAGGIETLRALSEPGVYEVMENRAQQLFDGIASIAKKSKIEVRLQRVGSMFGILFAPNKVRNYKESLAIDNKMFARFFHEVLSRGIYFPPSAVDAAALSAAHTPQDIENTLKVFEEVFPVLVQT
jgi:glutamate-1-semialdehyde 2,1-aminomutase